MTTQVFLVCGVPGAGKTWVCSQLTDRFTYVPHDDHIKQSGGILAALASASKGSEKPLLTECPFAERELRRMLEAWGFKVEPVFVVEPVTVVCDRYRAREGKPLPKASVTRATSIMDRVKEWDAPHGTSEAVLAYLKRRIAAREARHLALTASQAETLKGTLSLTTPMPDKLVEDFRREWNRFAVGSLRFLRHCPVCRAETLYLSGELAKDPQSAPLCEECRNDEPIADEYVSLHRYASQLMREAEQLKDERWKIVNVLAQAYQKPALDLVRVLAASVPGRHRSEFLAALWEIG